MNGAIFFFYLLRCDTDLLKRGLFCATSDDDVVRSLCMCKTLLVVIHLMNCAIVF